MSELAKRSYYTNIVSDLKNSHPGQWYSKLKRMTNYDQLKSEQVNVEEICHLPAKVQAERIAESFARVSNQYEPIDPSKITPSTITVWHNLYSALFLFHVHHVGHQIKKNQHTKE